MIEINLLPVEYRPKAAPKFSMPEIPIKKTLVTATGIVIGVQILAGAFAAYQTFELTGVKSQIAKLGAEGEGVAKEKAEMSRIGERLSKTVSMTQRKFYWSSLLNGLTHSMTKGVWLTGFTVTDMKPSADKAAASESKRPAAPPRILQLDGSVVGSGQETADIGRFLKQLKDDAVFNELFSAIELSNMTQRKVRDYDVYDFSIYCTFKPEKIDKPAKPEKGGA